MDTYDTCVAVARKGKTELLDRKGLENSINDRKGVKKEVPPITKYIDPICFMTNPSYRVAVEQAMNREAGKELEVEKQHINSKVTLVNAAFGRMDDEAKRLVKMRYVDGCPAEHLTGPDGKKLDYWNAMDIIHRGIQQFADFLVRVDEIKAASVLVDREENEYMEEECDTIRSVSMM